MYLQLSSKSKKINAHQFQAKSDYKVKLSNIILIFFLLQNLCMTYDDNTKIVIFFSNYASLAYKICILWRGPILSTGNVCNTIGELTIPLLVRKFVFTTTSEFNCLRCSNKFTNQF